MDQTKVSSRFHIFSTLGERFRWIKIKFSILDALVAILLMWVENDIDDVNNTPIR